MERLMRIKRQLWRHQSQLNPMPVMLGVSLGVAIATGLGGGIGGLVSGPPFHWFSIVFPGAVAATALSFIAYCEGRRIDGRFFGELIDELDELEAEAAVRPVTQRSRKDPAV